MVGDGPVIAISRGLPALIVFSLLYVASGAAGLLLAVPPGYATAIFPPAGLAVAGAFITGRRALSWVFVGAALLNLHIGLRVLGQPPASALPIALVIAAGSTVQAALGGLALRRFIGYPAALDNTSQLLRFFLLTPVFCLASASLSLSGMAAIVPVSAGDFAVSWFTWWIGDTLGVLVVLPLVMVAAGEPRVLWRKRAGSVALPMLLFFAVFVAIFVEVSRRLPTPSAAELADRHAWESFAVLIAGVFSTGLLGALLMLATGQRHRFQRLLEDRTRERDRIWHVSEDLLGVGNFAGYFVSINPAWTRVLGWSADQIRHMHVNELRHPEDFAIGTEGRKRLAEGVPTVRMENRFRCKDGSYRWIYWTMTAERGLIYVIGRDVTVEKETAQTLHRAEEQLRQSQKMQALGQLTGGIAHDFNNLLTVVIGNLEVIDESLAAGAVKLRQAIAAAINSAMRAATLTQRLLAYAQKQPLNPRPVDLNRLVTSMSDLIRQTHGENIRCELSLAEHLGSCFCDANQLETALLNLVINARDAMPRGGNLRLATAATRVDEDSAGLPDLAPGPYVMLSVQDDGIGMSPDTRAAAFEPFFTTKEGGKGTGLGLSMVYGFVKQSRGHIDIASELGRGTTVRILLPQGKMAEKFETPASAAPVRAVSADARAETILVVEDDDFVRGSIVEMLRALHYGVLAAADAQAALAQLAEPEHRIDLLLTDVMMPGMNGRDLAIAARLKRPDIKILFMSGYARDVIVHQGRLDPGIQLIEKPFRQHALAARVRAILDHTPESLQPVATGARS